MKLLLRCPPFSYFYSLSDRYSHEIKNRLSKDQLDFVFWYLDELDIESINKNVELFFRKRIRLPDNRSINFYESLPVLTRNVSSTIFNIYYFLALCRQSKALRLLLGEHDDYESFLQREHDRLQKIRHLLL